jgi:subtilisin family serine protease
MRQARRVGCALAVITVVALGALGPAGAAREAKRDYIVVLRPTASAPLVAAEHARKLAGTPKRIFRFALRGYTMALTDRQAAWLSADARVAHVEPDGPMIASATQLGATWGLDRIDQRTRPLSGSYTYSPTGAGVTAYVLDTGIRFDHVDFGGRAVSGLDAVDGGTADDCNGHGTHVAGTLGGTTWGVAKAVSLVAVRVLDCLGIGTEAGFIAGADWVVAHHTAGRPAVANISLGGEASDAVDAAVNALIADGVTTAVAAGNGFLGLFAQDACGGSPSRVPAALTISATNPFDRKASWANYGTCVDWFAPGIGITSAWHTAPTATHNATGTSMATPHTAGVAAQYLQANRASSPAAVRTALYAKTTKNVVTDPGLGSPNALLFTDSWRRASPGG